MEILGTSLFYLVQRVWKHLATRQFCLASHLNALVFLGRFLNVGIMSKLKKNTRFNPDWINKDLNPELSEWVRKDSSSPFVVRCAVCSKTIQLSNMGLQALKSHAETSSHVKNQAAAKQASKRQCTLDAFVPSTSSTGDASESQSNEDTVRPPFTSSDSTTTSGLSRLMVKAEVTKAEISWALRMVEKHMSYRSCSDLGEFLRTCFHDSEIVKKFTLGATKAAYL